MFMLCNIVSNAFFSLFSLTIISVVFLFFCYFLVLLVYFFFFFFSSRRRHTRCLSDWSSDVCSSDLRRLSVGNRARGPRRDLHRHAGGHPAAHHEPADGKC